MLSKESDSGQIGTIRKKLCGKRSRQKVFIDMEWVYRELDKGRTRQDVAGELGVHVNTLYSRHRKYQKQLELLENLQKQNENSAMDELPIPPEFRI